MRSVFICTTLVIVVSSVFSQRPIVRYSENLKKAVPHHYNHDQENADRGMDKIAGGHKIGPHQPPLRPQQDVPWLRWVHEGRWAAQTDKNSELHRVRARLLEEKLKPNHFAFKPHVNPQLKPKLKQKENGRTKRDAENTKVEKLQMETEIKVRHKRDIMMPQLVPELIMQPHFEAKIPQPLDQFNKEIKESEKREKRQILYFINKPPLLLARSPRTTPNPFIRDTHIEDYDIIRPEVGEREGMIPTVESGSSDLGSYPLVNEEASEFSKIITQFYLTTSDEYWPEIQRFADNILKPIFQLMGKKKELIEALENTKDIGGSFKAKEGRLNNVVEGYKSSLVNQDSNGTIHTRVKRRVNKTLKRKRAKKKKERLRRFEAKRLRMLTHARRVRKQQKSKQARLQRHYARMNMSTTATPDHLKNQTLIGEVVDQDTDDTRSNDKDEDGEKTDEEDDEYESSEYEDESEDSQTETKEESEGQTSKGRPEESKESGEDETDSDIGSKPDDGNDDYEDYDDESDDDYEDDESSEDESEEKKKKSGKGNKINTAIKSGGKHTLQMISRHKYNQPGGNLRNYASHKNTFNREKQSYINGNRKVNTYSHYKQNIDTDLEKKTLLSAQKQPLPIYRPKDRIQTNKRING